MVTRHRIPTIFNLSMVDVLCCALGCVILMWLINLREARQRSDAAGATSAQLATTQADLDRKTQESDRLRADLDRWQAEADTLRTDLEKTRGESVGLRGGLERASGDVNRLRGDLGKARTETERIQGDLSKSTLAADRLRLDLDRALAEGNRLRTELAAAMKAGAEARRQAEATASLLAEARTDLKTARSRSADLDTQMATLRTKTTDVEDRLAKKVKAQGDMDKELETVRLRVADLELLLRNKEALVKATTRTADDLAERLRDSDARAKQLRVQAEMVPELKEDARAMKEKLASAEARVQTLDKQMGEKTKDLAQANRTIQDLEESTQQLAQALAARGKDLADAGKLVDTLRTDRKRLSDQVVRVRAATVDRFAGITLTGRRVIFLVDMSGSMELVDEKTPAPEKWSGVRESLAKIMHSLPDLEMFQVILFSDKVKYLIGDGDRWLTYDAQTSLGQVTKVMTAVKPQGNTNMYAAFEEAFRFRSVGLDTIYLLSDGLPNIGTGLTAEAARTLKETEQAEVLSQHVRKTLRNDWNRALPTRPRVRINAVGFFYESPDVGAFLWALARENDGSFVGMSKP